MTAELIKFYYLGQPFAVAVALALALAAFGGAVITRPLVPLVLYLAVYFTFKQSNYGSLDVFAANPIYARGSGQLFFPALLWTLLVMVFWAWLGRRFSGSAEPAPSPLRRGLWAWAALLALHVVVGILLGQEPARILGDEGFVLMVWMLPLVHLMHAAGGQPRACERLALLLVAAGLAKAVYGLVRWGFFGGDPANVYQNYGQIDVRLTFFDVADVLVCLLGAAASAALLFVAPGARRGVGWRVLLVLTLAACVAAVVLSYRRTAWGGLVVGLLWLLWLADRRLRWLLLALLLPVALLLQGVWLQRLSVQGGGAGLLALFFDLRAQGVGADSTRLLELKLAWAAFAESPLVGLGAWGRFAHSQLVPWQIHSGGGFVHSGVLHLMMKAGLVGLLLLAGVMAAFVIELRRALRATDPWARALAAVAGCGAIFMLPDLLFGTPVPQLRTMQLLAFCLGLPGLVLAARAVAKAR